MTIDRCPGAESSNLHAVIFDVDGTLCDVRSVRHYVEAPPEAKNFRADFNRFHSESMGCPAHRAVRDLALAARDAGFKILIVTGRAAKWHKLTVDWLAVNDIHWDQVFTRGEKDFRQDHVIKKEIADEIHKMYEPVLAVDDRSDIIEVWQQAGISTIQVTAEGELLSVTHCNALQRDLLENQLHLKAALNE